MFGDFEQYSKSSTADTLLTTQLRRGLLTKREFVSSYRVLYVYLGDHMKTSYFVVGFMGGVLWGIGMLVYIVIIVG